MRKYKIVVEKLPSEDFTRYIPKVADTILKTGEIVTDDKLEWEILAGETGYFKSKEDAENSIERHELWKKKCEGGFILYEEEYIPNKC
jgi:hypothetical protein